MTSKLRQMSVNASVRLSMWCQHFQNPKAPRPLGRCRWNLARIFYGPGGTTSVKQNFEFRPMCHTGQPRT